MVGLIDNDDISHLRDFRQAFWESSSSGEVCMVENDKVAEVSVNTGQTLSKFFFPNRPARSFWDDERHFFPLVIHEPVNQH
jgi:hypothetical protein